MADKVVPVVEQVVKTVNGVISESPTIKALLAGGIGWLVGHYHWFAVLYSFLGSHVK